MPLRPVRMQAGPDGRLGRLLQRQSSFAVDHPYAPVSFVYTCAFPTLDSSNHEEHPASTVAMFSVCWATTFRPYT